MNHPVEMITWALVERLLAKVDPAHEGWCIDAGAGADDWYFERFADLGHKTLVIDPAITPQACVSIAERPMVRLNNSLIAKENGMLMLYMGDDPNTYTTVRDRIDTLKSRIGVPALPLFDFVDIYDITRLTCLKLDIEGMEPEVIQSLPDCKILPDILVFEFGGFVKRKDVSGPWSVENVAQVNAAMQTLDKFGYGTMWAITDVDERPFVIGANGWFDFISPECGYGNIVAVREEAFHG